MDLNQTINLITGIVCICILVDGIFYLSKAFKLNKYFESLLKDFNENKGGNSNFQSEALNNIKSEFNKSLQNVSNVNTQVIIEKYLYPEDNKLKKWESKLDYMANLSTILGLLGTFLGLTFAVKTIGQTLTSTDIDGFLIELKPAISSMSGAFITSIVGLAGSILMNLIGANYRVTKQNLLDQIEGYLDNEEAKNKLNDSKSMLNMLQNMVDSINAMNSNTEKSANEMKNLVSDISALNEEMKGFNTKMDQNSKNLIEATNGFNEVVEKFEKPLNSFKNSMDDFISSYNGMDDKIENLSKLVNESFKEIVDKFIEYFDKNTRQQMDFIKDNNKVQEETIKSMKESTNAISGNMRDLEIAYTNLAGVIKHMENSLTTQNTESTKTLIDLQNVLANLNTQVKDMSERLAKETSRAISNSTIELNRGLLLELQNVTNQMRKQLDEISKEFNNVQGQQQKDNKEALELMKVTIQAIYKNVEQLQAISLVNK